MEEPSPLSVFCYPNDDRDHSGCAPLPSERPPPLWPRLPQPNRMRLLRVLSRLLERQLQAEASRPMEAMTDELNDLDVHRPVVNGRTVVEHAI